MTPTRATQRLWIPVLVILLLSCAWVGIRGLNADALWFDEYYSLVESGGTHFGPLTPLDLVLRVASYSTWPPGYNLLFAAWGSLVGWSQVAGRVLSLLLGLLTLAALYRLGWQIGRNRRAGFYAALTALLYSHPVGQVVFGVVVLYHLLIAPRGPQKRALWMPLIGAGVLYLPWVAVMLARVYQELQVPRARPLAEMLGSTFYAYSNGLPLIVAALGVFALTRLRGRSAGFAAWWLAATLMLALIVNVAVPFWFHPRLLMALLPALAVLLALILDRAGRLGPILLLAWAIFGVVLYTDAGFMANLPGAARTIPWPGFSATLNALRTQADPADVVLFRVDTPDQEKWQRPILEYYLLDAPFRFAPFALIAPPDENTAAPYSERLSQFVGNAARVWLAELTGIPTDETQDETRPTFAQTLDALHYRPCPAVVDLPDMRLIAYVQDSAACP